MWDGRFDTLQRQTLAAFESPLEFNSSRLFLAQRIFTSYRAEYEAIFGPLPPLDDAARFPALTPQTTGCNALVDLRNCATVQRGAPGDGAEFDSMSPEDQVLVTRVAINASKAIAAHVRTLTCGPSRFDAWVHGEEDVLDEEEQRGA